MLNFVHVAPSKSRKPAGARSGLPDDSVDANNMRKAWKSAQERVADIALAERARELSNPVNNKPCSNLYS